MTNPSLWLTQDQGGIHIQTDEEVLNTYWDWWSTHMYWRGKLLYATPHACLDEWCVVNWAVPLTPDNWKEILKLCLFSSSPS